MAHHRRNINWCLQPHEHVNPNEQPLTLAASYRQDCLQRANDALETSCIWLLRSWYASYVIDRNKATAYPVEQHLILLAGLLEPKRMQLLINLEVGQPGESDHVDRARNRLLDILYLPGVVPCMMPIGLRPVDG